MFFRYCCLYAVTYTNYLTAELQLNLRFWSFFTKVMLYENNIYFSRLNTNQFSAYNSISTWNILQYGMWIGKKNCSWEGGQCTYCCDSWHITPIGCYMIFSPKAICHNIVSVSRLLLSPRPSVLIIYSRHPMFHLLPACFACLLPITAYVQLDTQSRYLFKFFSLKKLSK